MTRLTRTQKYADLRNQMENSSEPQLNTKELASYEDRLERSGGDGLPGSEARPDYSQVHGSQEVETPMPATDAETTDTNVAQEEVEELKVEEPEVNDEQYEIVDNISISDLLGEGGFGGSFAPTEHDYVKDTLDEVKAYNKSIGSMTVEDVPATILNEIRGVNEEDKDDLSNTVTLEIKKFLAEMNEPEEEPMTEEVADEAEADPSTFEAEPAHEEPLVAEEVTSDDDSEETYSENDLEKMRMLAEKLPKDVSDLLKQYLESTQEDVYSEPEETLQAEVEEEALVAETINETVDTQLEATSSTISSTITTTPLMNDTMPLQVDRSTSSIPKVEDNEEYNEVSGSSRILNIILVVLIVILVLVLIVVAYLILVAQGVIPNLF